MSVHRYDKSSTVNFVLLVEIQKTQSAMFVSDDDVFVYSKVVPTIIAPKKVTSVILVLIRIVQIIVIPGMVVAGIIVTNIMIPDHYTITLYYTSEDIVLEAIIPEATVIVTIILGAIILAYLKLKKINQTKIGLEGKHQNKLTQIWDKTSNNHKQQQEPYENIIRVLFMDTMSIEVQLDQVRKKMRTFSTYAMFLRKSLRKTILHSDESLNATNIKNRGE
uniref:Uncharacterized protein n=1 Tax=Vespula pensylvanica TaxID=30213 RepID=A0A834KQQ4_VESPE|nr:hypothetical protein H0235_013704 [Vespula pensylvanica]